MIANRYLAKINALITEDFGKRGLCHTNDTSDFNEAVYSLWQSTSVLIVTGFCIRDVMRGETDGPLGAVVLGSALQRLGKEVVLATDRFSSQLLDVCCQVYDFSPAVELVPFAGALQSCNDILCKYQPSHVIGLERPSRARDGRCYSMRGEDLSDIIPDTDGFFSRQGANPPVTVGIGDGGNELGMGKYALELARSLPNGDTIWAATVADYAIPVAVSNWGAYGLSAALSMLSSQFLLHEPHVEERFLTEMIKAGAVDGCTKQAGLSVDGIALHIHKNLVKQLGALVNDGS